MATLFDPGIFSVMGIAGNALVGATLTWQTTAGATISTYVDQGLVTPNTSPVVADAQGRFPQIWLAAGNYKFILKDAVGTVLRTQNPYIADAAIPTIAAALNSFLAGASALPIANGGTGATDAGGAVVALGALPLTGGAVTGEITRATKGAFLYNATAAMNKGAVYLTASAAADPTTVAGEWWLKY